MQDGSKKAVLAACAANLGIGVAKLVGFFLTGAASMLAEAVHSAADTGNQALLLLGGSRAKRAATTEHPFGYGRERYFWAFVVALVLFALGSLFAIIEGIEKLLEPHALESPLIAVAILGLSLLLEGLSFITAIREARKLKGAKGWFAFIKQTKQAELPVVLLEDLGALLGLAIALSSVGLTVLTGDARFDGAGSILIGLLLGAIAIVLAREMQSLLIGEAASREDVAMIRKALEGAPDIRRVVHMRTMHLAPDELLIGVKIELTPALTFEQIAAAINQAEDRIRQNVPNAGVIYVEPDQFDATRADEQ